MARSSTSLSPNFHRARKSLCVCGLMRIFRTRMSKATRGGSALIAVRPSVLMRAVATIPACFPSPSYYLQLEVLQSVNAPPQMYYECGVEYYRQFKFAQAQVLLRQGLHAGASASVLATASYSPACAPHA